ncbi:hypothetical protein IM774_10095 [Erysipelotrichaceae bacterium RD49]|nr:hypothetical protein [Erysipelotrichaceae bacterium RD49]
MLESEEMYFFRSFINLSGFSDRTRSEAGLQPPGSGNEKFISQPSTKRKAKTLIFSKKFQTQIQSRQRHPKGKGDGVDWAGYGMAGSFDILRD